MKPDLDLTPEEDGVLAREMEALEDWLRERAEANGGSWAPGASAVVVMARGIVGAVREVVH